MRVLRYRSVGRLPQIYIENGEIQTQTVCRPRARILHHCAILHLIKSLLNVQIKVFTFFREQRTILLQILLGLNTEMQ